MVVRGKVWKYGDNIDTDKIIPARYLNTTDPKELAKHCLEDEDPTFVSKVQPGDIIVAGKNFGSGSSREHAVISIKAVGVSAVVAKSFAGIFFRNSINRALPIIEAPEAVDSTDTGDVLEIDLEGGVVRNLTKNKEFRIKPFPQFLFEIFNHGGIMNYAKARIEQKKQEKRGG
ncbi:MAG: 3-isopropylmalate dehydratase small subunit [Spirochaetia bacterium]|nr:3-isopropylmalate dehydratase small subunit [Spirochaetota bacterium]MCX8096537.1 3-isopropylmalate dehydratase small subunit [Spirochaetota bacterium]MDW8112695.1 3-isopropylmalate dehydratase small subunit [Spirochaetia bacterium]